MIKYKSNQPAVTIIGSKKAMNALQKAGIMDQLESTTVLDVVVPKVKPKQKSETEKQAEEFIALWKELDPLAKKLKRMDDLKKSLTAAIKDEHADTDKPFVFETEAGTIEFTRCADSLEVTDREKMLELLGDETAQLIAQYNLGDLRKYLSENQLAQITKAVPGARRLASVKPKE